MVSARLRQNRPEAKERNSQQYPHPENPGLIEGPDGCYDWADRRLFLPSGEPDPATPGAYRYQTRPDLCDLQAPDSDPASPRYEPPHLRHRPGDTWIIDTDRPHDPEDPGPYGTSGWRQDRRTGRHRRDELPDPIPPWEQDSRDPQDDIDTEPPRPRDRRGGGHGGGRGSGFTLPRPRPGCTDRTERHGDGGDAEGGTGGYRFSRLREDAWDRFMIDSVPLADAHRPQTRNALDREAGPVWSLWIHLARWFLAVFRGTAAQPAPVEPALEEPRGTQKPHGLQETGGCASRPGTHERASRSVARGCARRPAAPGDRHVLMARAPAGAQLARAESRASVSDYVRDWEWGFDASGQTTGRLAGGAAWG
ncbi:hypothetical protein [Glycomyces arizonensis]|uniref:hypothetical protein n=1 Tax=Glycomyces arizonensis TaxID=256035 RepID=UPI0003F730BF|nr:hypothetical protein [Glycomyces arizonensis]